MKKIIVAVLTALVLVGCGNKPEDVAKDFTNALYKGDADKAMSYIEVPKAKNENEKMQQEMVLGKLKPMLQSGAKKAEAKGGVDSIKVKSSDVNDDIANIIMEVKFKNNTSIDERIKLTKIDGKWKVLME